MVPLRKTMEEFGLEVDWDDYTRTVTARAPVMGTVITLAIDHYEATVNGVPVTLDQPGMIVNERTLVPLRFVAEAVGATVEWNPTTRIVIITSSYLHQIPNINML